MPDWVSFVSAFVKVFSSVVVARMVLFWTGMYCCLNVDGRCVRHIWKNEEKTLFLGPWLVPRHPQVGGQ